MKYILATIFFVTAAATCAGELVKNAEVVLVGNTANGGDDFFITISGGTGVCSNITFPVSVAVSKEAHARAYSLALIAFTTGSKKVRVYNFSSDSCTTASYIEIAK